MQATGQEAKRVQKLTRMRDLAIELGERHGALADLGEALGLAGISIEGGGVWGGVAHFLFVDWPTAQRAVERAGLKVLAIREVLVQRLNQDEPGQLGKISRRMAEAGVNIQVMYSDHNYQLILVVDDIPKGRVVSDAWIRHRRLIL
jgi:hypothetical protein